MDEREICRRAAQELGFDVPVLRLDSLPKGVFELHLYGGRVVRWQPEAKPAAPAKAAGKRKEKK